VGAPSFVTGCLDVANDKIWIFFANHDAGPSRYEAAIRVYSSLVASVAATVLISNAGIGFNYGPRITAFLNSASQAYFYYEVLASTPAGHPVDRFPIVMAIFQNTFSSAGVSGTAVGFHYDLNLAGKPFKIASRHYVPCLHSYGFQFMYFIIRDDGFICAKILATEGGDRDFVASPLPACTVESTYVLHWPTQIRKKVVLTDLSAAVFSNAVNTEIVESSFGVSKSKLDFSLLSSSIDSEHRQFAQVNSSSLITGAVTSVYDGLNVVEHGFHVSPSDFSTSGITTVDGIRIVQNGTAGLPEIFDFACFPGAYFYSASPAASGSINFSNALDANLYYMWFTRDNLGADPAPGGRTGFGVPLDSSMSSLEVAQNIVSGLSALSGISLAIVLSTQYSEAPYAVRFTNTANGNSTNAVAGANSPYKSRRETTATYQYCCIYEWTDAKGQIYRSAPSPSQSISYAANQTGETVTSVNTLTWKRNPRDEINVVFFRTLANGSVFYRIQPPKVRISPFTSTISEGNAQTISAIDNFSDAEIDNNEVLYTTGGVLDVVAPPESKIIKKAKNRVFLYRPETNQVWYSKEVQEGLAVEFNDALTLQIDSSPLPLTGIEEMDDKLLFFKKDKPFFIVGDGPNDLGQGSFSSADPIVSPVGISEIQGLIKTDMGIVGKSSKGFYFWDRKLDNQFIGAPMEDESGTVMSSVLMPSKSQIRFLMSNDKWIIYDYDMRQWSTRPNPTATWAGSNCDAVLWKGLTYAVLRSNGRVWTENTSSFQDNSTNYVTLIETGWIKTAALQGFMRARRAALTGEYKSAHTISVQVGYDYEDAYTETYTFTPGTSNPLQFEMHLARQKCEALRFKITETNSGTLNECNTLTNLSLEVGLKKGLKKLPAAQKT
jgi:hypothetical protein